MTADVTLNEQSISPRILSKNKLELSTTPGVKKTFTLKQQIQNSLKLDKTFHQAQQTITRTRYDPLKSSITSARDQKPKPSVLREVEQMKINESAKRAFGPSR